MSTRQALLLSITLALSGCGHKEPPPASAAPKSDNAVSIESQGQPAPPPPPVNAASPDQPAAAAPATAEPASEPGDPTLPENQKRYARNMEWLRAIKMGDEKQKQQTAAAIKKANLSAKERAELEELKAHYNIQYPIQY